MVPVRMGQIDPAKVGRVDVGPESLQEVPSGCGHSGIHQQWLLGLQKVGVHRQKAQAGDFSGVGECDNIGGGP